MSGSPVDQLLRSVSPAQAERRVEESLRLRTGGCQPEARDAYRETPDQVETHTRKIGFFRRVRKPGRHRGSMLVEATLAMAMLSTIGLILLKLSLNVTTPRQWTLQQAITDSYLTIEKATAQRQSFENIIGPTSLWPLDPVTTTVEFGKLPGGTPITGTITRRRTAGPDNDIAANNPAGMRVWHLQSVARYTVGSRSYIKSRTVVRSQ